MAKTSKIAKAPKSFKSYALNKCLIGYGVVNGIINAAIFAGINAGAPDAMFGMHDIVHDLAFTGLLLGMLLFACVVPLTRMDLRKGVFSLPGAAGGAFPLVSSSYAVSILGVGALAAVVMTGAPNRMICRYSRAYGNIVSVEPSSRASGSRKISPSTMTARIGPMEHSATRPKLSSAA